MNILPREGLQTILKISPLVSLCSLNIYNDVHEFLQASHCLFADHRIPIFHSKGGNIAVDFAPTGTITADRFFKVILLAIPPLVYCIQNHTVTFSREQEQLSSVTEFDFQKVEHAPVFLPPPNSNSIA